MSSKDILVLAALGVGAVIYMQSRKKPAVVGGTNANNSNTKNVSDQLWTSLLGGAWTAIRDAKNPDGTMAFLKKNWLGQIVTSDGKPVGSQLAEMFPYAYGDGVQDSIDYGSTPNLIDGLFPSLSGTEWQ
ncbi:hypothetical protein CLU90_1001 [Janthinobacterium sp. 67]|uniref:hypothetical protein n=1 Tax=Janthinobacterium sp. 67 TaxID=2035207 RepID=UPI000C23EFBE|nr:hypothetical protein [Janthinobacterium sp. 67]PJJ17821.1 hypothetical protein CLU90_1001 [Janthinobacterium sp. 67]